MSGGDGGGSRRLARVAGQVQEEVAGMLLRGELRGRGTSDVLVSRVEMSPDLQLARVYVRLLDPSADERRRREALRGLDRGKAFVRREVGRRLGLRRAPEIAFFWDVGVDHALRVEGILDEIRREEPGSLDADADADDDAGDSGTEAPAEGEGRDPEDGSGAPGGPVP